MNQARCASRSVLLQDIVSRLAEWMTTDNYRLIEQPDSSCNMLSDRPPDYAVREQLAHGRLLSLTAGARLLLYTKLRFDTGVSQEGDTPP